MRCVYHVDEAVVYVLSVIQFARVPISKYIDSVHSLETQGRIVMCGAQLRNYTMVKDALCARFFRLMGEFEV